MTPVKPTSLSEQRFTERDLENLISKNITELIPETQLMVFFRERPFQEETDILALDKNGDLYIFEFKRWGANQEHILQVLRYGQKFGQYTYEQLEEMLRKYAKDKYINLAEEHYEYFQESTLENKLSPSHFNRKQHFVIITDGINKKALSAIKYWNGQGMLIESIPYKVYVTGSKSFLEFIKYNHEKEVLLESLQKDQRKERLIFCKHKYNMRSPRHVE